MKRNFALIIILSFLNLTSHATAPSDFLDFAKGSWFSIWESSPNGLKPGMDINFSISKKDAVESEFDIGGYCTSWTSSSFTSSMNGSTLHMDNATGVVSMICGSEKVPVGAVKGDRLDVKLWNCATRSSEGDLNFQILTTGEMKTRYGGKNRWGNYINCAANLTHRL